jgi:signal transduction histidine kinase
MTDHVATDPNPSSARSRLWFVGVIGLLLLAILAALGWSYAAAETLITQIEQIDGTTKVVDLSRQLERLELAVVRSERLDDPKVRDASALVARSLEAMEAPTDGTDVAPELAPVRAQYSSFELIRTTRPEAKAEATQIIGRAGQAAETAADAAASLRREQISAQTNLVAKTALRGGLAAAIILVSNAGLVLTMRRMFKTSYANAYELRLERAAELEQCNRELRLANESKHRFVSMVSHELRTPLTVIRGSAETLLRYGDGLKQSRRAQLCSAILRQAQRQQRMVEDLLIVARHSDAALKPRPLVFDIRETVATLVSELGDGLRHKVAIDEGGPLAWADPRHVEQIAENLLTNADKYGGNRIWVEFHEGMDGQVIVCVCDDGPGVPDALANTMFDEFSQGDGGDTRASSGVGLGLSITRTLALANDGLVRYRHHEGGGSQFELLLPGATREASDAQARPADLNPYRRADGPADRP